MTFDESKVNRSGGGQFSEKHGSAPEANLVQSPSEEYAKEMEALEDEYQRRKNEVSARLLGAATSETIRASFPDATAIVYSHRNGYYEEDSFFSIEEVWEGESLAYRQPSWEDESPGGPAPDVEDRLSELDSALRSLWWRNGDPESESLPNSQRKISL